MSYGIPGPPEPPTPVFVPDKPAPFAPAPPPPASVTDTAGIPKPGNASASIF